MAPDQTTQREPVDQFHKELTRSGSGGGVALHFNAEFAAEYKLDPETEVVVEVVERNGDVAIQIDNVPAGFTYEELHAYADDQGWEATTEYADEERDEWFLTYRTDDGDGAIAIEIDSESRIGGNVVNNVTIRSDPVDVTDDFERYNAVCGVAQRRGLNVSLADSDGLWERLKAAPESDADGGPDRETFEQLSDQVDTITAGFVDTRSSLQTTLESIGETARAMNEAYEQIAE